MKKKIYTEEELKERQKESQMRYLSTEKGKKMYRAKYLLYNYRKEDKLYGRELPDMDSKWIVENIFTKCFYCGEDDWTKLGCDRIDNSKGHIKSNVVPSCLHCNMVKLKDEKWKKKYGNNKRKRVDQIDRITGEVLHKWDCSKDAAEELGFNAENIRQCCLGKKHTHNDYIWKYALE